MKIIIADLNKNVIEACKSFTKEKKYIEAYEGSIFDLKCDAIVSPANSFGFMNGGIDRAISENLGWHIQMNLQQKIREKHYGELLVGNAEIVKTGNIDIPYVIAAPTMRIPMILHDSVNIYLAVKAVLLLVKYGKFEDGTSIKDKVFKIGMPGMGTGTGLMSPEVFVKQVKKAYEDIIEEKYVFPMVLRHAESKHMELL